MAAAAERRAMLNRLARDVARTIAHHDLLFADLLLDQARRFFLTSALSGAADSAVLNALPTPGEAVAIAGRYIGLSMEEVLTVDTHIRLNLWCAHFAAAPGTRFGAGFASALEEARRYSEGKPN
jgi:hypothetical protein